MKQSPQWFAAVCGVLTIATILVGCATPQPRGELSAELVRVTLETRPQDRIEAYRRDGQLVDGLRFDDLTPGAHDLRIRHHFENIGSAGGTGLLGEPQWERCILGVRYANFAAGEQYIFAAERRGWRSVGWLRSASGETLAEAQVIRCGPGV